MLTVAALPARRRAVGEAALIGRFADLDAIRAAVAQSRLVSLVGESGVGKTRLALAIAAERGAAAVLCDLRDAQSAQDICMRVTEDLGMDAAVGATQEGPRTIGRVLSARGPLLVVLDGVEAVSSATATLVEGWLALAPELRVLCTSRRELGLGGERVVAVWPLSLPPLDDAQASEPCWAMRLFVERVEAVRGPDGLVGHERAAAELVRRTQGLPLAIELCAARLGAEPIGAIIGQGAGLDQPAVAWAFASLALADRDLLARCSIFHGGFTPEAGEAVLFAEPSEAVALAALVRSRLLQPMQSDGQLRYFLPHGLCTVAAAELAESPSAQPARLRHAEYYLALASHAPAQSLAPERANLEAALDLGASLRRRDLVLRAAVALDVASSGTGLMPAQLARLGEALAWPGNTDPALLGRALGARAAALRGLGRLDEAERDAMTALSLAQQSKDDRQTVAMLHAVGMARFQRGDLPMALEPTRQALDLARRIGDGALESLALQQIAGVLNALGDRVGGAASFCGALDLAVQHGAPMAEMRALMGLAFCMLEDGDFVRAETLWQRALDIAERLPSPRNARITAGYLGLCCFDAGRLAQAEAWLTDAVAGCKVAGDARNEGFFEGIRGAVLAELGRIELARAAFDLARAVLAPNPYFGEVVEVFEGHLDLAEARAALAQGARYRADNLIALARRRMDAAEHAGERPLVTRSDDARIALRLLGRSLERLSGPPGQPHAGDKTALGAVKLVRKSRRRGKKRG